jgi:hypothetical protein
MRNALALLKGLLGLAAFFLCARALTQEPRQVESQQTPRDKAWELLRTGVHARIRPRTNKRQHH